MEKRERRSFDKAFKLMVVELNENGKPSTEIFREVDIPSNLVRRWSRKCKSNFRGSFSGDRKPVLSDEQKEILELKECRN